MADKKQDQIPTADATAAGFTSDVKALEIEPSPAYRRRQAMLASRSAKPSTRTTQTVNETDARAAKPSVKAARD